MLKNHYIRKHVNNRLNQRWSSVCSAWNQPFLIMAEYEQTVLVGAFYQNEPDCYSGKFSFLYFSSDRRMYG